MKFTNKFRLLNNFHCHVFSSFSDSYPSSTKLCRPSLAGLPPGWDRRPCIFTEKQFGVSFQQKCVGLLCTGKKMHPHLLLLLMTNQSLLSSKSLKVMIWHLVLLLIQLGSPPLFNNVNCRNNVIENSVHKLGNSIFFFFNLGNLFLDSLKFLKINCYFC